MARWVSGSVRVLPLRMIESNAETKSVNVVSTSSRPVRTSMMSELGLVYFLLKRLTRNAVKVCVVSMIEDVSHEIYLHQGRFHLEVRCWHGSLQQLGKREPLSAAGRC